MELSNLKLTNKRLEICSRLDLKNSEDILSYYPFKYEQYNIIRYKDFKEGEQVFFEGELLTSPSVYRYAGRRSVTRFKVLYEEEEISVSIFNRPWIRNIKLNSKITILGKYEGNNKVVANNYFLKDINEIKGIIPFYSLKNDITQNEVRKLIEYTFVKTKDSIVEDIPSAFIKEHQLISKEEALYNIHFPLSHENLKKSLARLKYEEFLKFYIGLNYLKSTSIDSSKRTKIFKQKDVDTFIDELPYELTKDQLCATKDILNDLSSNKTMHRLLQGEVGSGKTAVSMIALYANYLAGYQGALMVPTEILAKQHFESFSSQYKNTNCKIDLLYSNSSNMKEIKEKLKKGEIDILIGTHALFQEDVEFNKLGLVIADEQQRFGVKQRRALMEKGENPDVLLMSATPIPRTLASSMFGDSDVSTIETMPSNRKGCKTFLIKKNSIVDIIDELKEELAKGRQMYIIASVIDPSSNVSAKDANTLYESLIDAFKPYKLGLLHGRMTNDEKDRIMNDFNQNMIQILVSTTVVEVGVNVKNATTMVIYDAERFGLAQLHQLRGRIQRGNIEGKCYLLTSSKEEDALKRLNVLVKTNNGFEISFEDLRLRGPGDILGTRQSGLPAFILGNIVEDTKFIDAARADALKICSNLNDKENKFIYDKIALNAKNNSID